MKSEVQCRIKRIFKLGLLPVALLFMANADALLLGDIRVNSALGQPLKAHIAIVDLIGIDVQQIKIHLASFEDYQNLGLQYPDPHNFNFLLVNEPGALLPEIRITTPYPLVDPFINLLVEVSSPAGRLIRAYTFLLDPSAESAGASAEQHLFPAVSSPKIAGEVSTGEISPLNARPKKHHQHNKHDEARLQLTQIEHGLSHGSLRMKLSLSISSYAPSAQVVTSRDVLQEELIAKEQSLEDLKLQVGEMQLVIKSLEGKQAGAASLQLAAVASASSVLAASNVPAAPKIADVVPPARENPVQAATRWTINWLYVDLVLFATLLSGSVVLYRKYKLSQSWRSGPFDDLHEEECIKVAIQEPLSIQEETPLASPKLFSTAFLTEVMPQLEATPKAKVSHEPLQFESLSFGEPVEPVTVAQDLIVPPEYAILMEAKQHLRAGKDELAEAALMRAIVANPKNLYGYQALSNIYEARKDAEQFERIARQLKEIGDVTAFEDLAERGRILDPENPLYL